MVVFWNYFWAWEGFLVGALGSGRVLNNFLSLERISCYSLGNWLCFQKRFRLGADILLRFFGDSCLLNYFLSLGRIYCYSFRKWFCFEHFFKLGTDILLQPWEVVVFRTILQAWDGNLVAALGSGCVLNNFLSLGRISCYSLGRWLCFQQIFKLGTDILLRPWDMVVFWTKFQVWEGARIPWVHGMTAQAHGIYSSSARLNARREGSCHASAHMH